MYWNRSKAFSWGAFLIKKKKKSATVLWPKQSMGSPSNPLTELEAHWGHSTGMQMAAAPKKSLRVACLSIRLRKEFCWFLKVESYHFHGTRLFPLECEKRMGGKKGLDVRSLLGEISALLQSVVWTEGGGWRATCTDGDGPRCSSLGKWLISTREVYSST